MVVIIIHEAVSQFIILFEIPSMRAVSCLTLFADVALRGNIGSTGLCRLLQCLVLYCAML
uniref:Uncharacterized protein n=1 Tax=Arundo donax TaxID=35708 RepID=A0A0A9FGX1_ARUDO